MSHTMTVEGEGEGYAAQATHSGQARGGHEGSPSPRPAEGGLLRGRAVCGCWRWGGPSLSFAGSLHFSLSLSFSLPFSAAAGPPTSVVWLLAASQNPTRTATFSESYSN